MNMYRQEVKFLLRSALVWGFWLSVLSGLICAIYPTMSSSMDELNQMLQNYPPELITAFGLDSMDFSTIIGWLGFVFLFVQLAATVQAANYGFALVSTEERELTADFLLTRPVSRTQILNAKLLAALSALGITNAMLWAASYTSAGIFGRDNGFDAGKLAVLLGSVIFLQLFFLGVGAGLSLLFRRIRSIPPYSLALVFAMYVLKSFADESLPLLKLVPFTRFETGVLAQSGHYDPSGLITTLGISLVGVGLCYMLYLRRDVHSV